MRTTVESSGKALVFTFNDDSKLVGKFSQVVPKTSVWSISHQEKGGVLIVFDHDQLQFSCEASDGALVVDSFDGAPVSDNAALTALLSGAL